MDVTLRREDTTLIAHLRGRIEGLPAASSLQVSLEEAFEPTDKALILDFENLSYISSAGLRIVAIMINRTRMARMKFVLCCLIGPTQEIINISGFNQLVTVAETLDDAREIVVEALA